MPSARFKLPLGTGSGPCSGAGGGGVVRQTVGRIFSAQPHEGCTRPLRAMQAAQFIGAVDPACPCCSCAGRSRLVSTHRAPACSRAPKGAHACLPPLSPPDLPPLPARSSTSSGGRWWPYAGAVFTAVVTSATQSGRKGYDSANTWRGHQGRCGMEDGALLGQHAAPCVGGWCRGAARMRCAAGLARTRA